MLRMAKMTTIGARDAKVNVICAEKVKSQWCWGGGG